MAKGVMLSIRPKHCDDIARGDKTWEIRKNKPNLPTPFKCYIYRTKGKVGHIINGQWNDLEVGGKVVADFICDNIIPINVFENGSIQDWNKNELEKTCLSYEDLAQYIGWGNTGYAWHISNLNVYEEGEDIENFAAFGKCPYNLIDGCSYPYHCFRAGETERCGHFLSRPPQSWGYVESG